MDFHATQLENGLNIVGETNPGARSVALGFFVRTGSRDETPELLGVSHFLEHMVFKGTERRSALDVNRDFDAIGADYNAYTSEENTVFHGQVLPEYLPNLVDILSDILRPSLRVDDFSVEKKVILEEIGMYNDRPGWSAYIAAKEAFFASHPLANNVLGTDDTIGKLSCEQMREYFARRYVAPNITVVAAGNFEWPAFVDLIAKQCGNWPSGPAVRTLLPVAGNPLTRVVTRPKIIQEHAFLLSPGPAPASELRFSAEILANAVGDDSGSRLYWTLVDPGHADSADMGYHEYDGTGAFCTYFSGEPDRAAENLQKALAVLAEVQKNGITVEELQVARSKLAALLVRRSERTMGRMKAVGFYWSYLKTYRTVDDDLRALDSVSLDTVRQVLDRFPIVEPTVLAFGPLEALE